MKLNLFVIIAFLFSCNTVKKSEGQLSVSNQLLKDVEILSSDKFEGRKTGTNGAELAKTYITKRFKEIGLKNFEQLNGYEQTFNFKSGDKVLNGKNLIGYIRGKTDSAIVISAHYDHIGIIDGKIYNGADDNASGVAALLKFGAYFVKNKPNYTLIFAAFDAEEMGLQGAKHFVTNTPIPLSNIKLNINMDMISHNDKAELYACGTFKYPELRKYFVFSNNKIKVLFGHDDPKQGHNDWTNQSDHAAFNQKNIPFIYFGVEDHKDYHKDTDEFDNINKAFFIDAAEAIQEVINNIDKKRDRQTMFDDLKRMKKQ